MTLSPTRLAGLVALACCASGALADSTTCVDYTSLGTYQDLFVVQDGLTVEGSDFIQVTPDGLGVVGGADDTALEDGETLYLSFGDPRMASHFWLQIGSPTDGGNGTPGELLLDAFGPAGAEMGQALVDGAGTFYLNGLFNGSPIALLSVRPLNGDSVKITGACFGEIMRGKVVEYGNLGTYTTPELDLGGVRVTGSDDIFVFNMNGLGILDGKVGDGEWIRFDFDGFMAEHVWFTFTAVFSGGHTRVTGYGPNGVNLGSVEIQASDTHDVVQLFGGSPLSGVLLEPIDGDGLRVGSCSYQSRETGCQADFDHDGQTTVLDFGVFALDFGCDDGE